MHYGIEVVPFGEFGHPHQVVEFARAAEAAGWEGLWVWDHVLFPYGVGDPWVLLAAAAAVTRKLKLVVGVAPLPRYRPHLLSRLLVSLDLLSGGRVIFGAGLGFLVEEYAAFGEETDARLRAEKTDEGLELLAKLWSGEAVTHEGRHYTARNVQQAFTPVQKPRLPVWIGGDSPAALRRAACWDGWITGTVDENCRVTKTPEQLAQGVAAIRRQRAEDRPFDVAIDGTTPAGGAAAYAEPYARAGATWYFESVFGLRGGLEEMTARIQAGP